jgi:anti-sigma B factor antagonist
MSSPFRVELVPERETLVVAAHGELDVAGAPELQSVLAEARSAGFDQVVLDLTGVTFMDSTGVALVLGAARAHPGRRPVAVEPGAGQPRDVLALAGVLEALPSRRAQARRTSNEIAPT